MEDFVEISTGICSRKLLVVAKEMENIHPGNVEVKKRGETH
jgi:hypothetical protein